MNSSSICAHGKARFPVSMRANNGAWKGPPTSATPSPLSSHVGVVVGKGPVIGGFLNAGLPVVRVRGPAVCQKQCTWGVSVSTLPVRRWYLEMKQVAWRGQGC